jgi:serine/threonine-protein kinase
MVQLVVSAGPAPRTVPKLIGLTVPKATAALSEQQLGIKVKSPTEFHPSIPAGAIIRQSVKPGGKVDRDSTVTVVVSKGPDLVAVPSPIGLDYRQVRSAITKAGFNVGKVTGDTSKRPTKFTVDGKVVHHGDRIPRGSTIDIAYQP